MPLHKGDGKDKFNHYRPILPAFSKLLEKIAAIQMFKYLNKFNILYRHRYGFRPNHNSNQPLLHLLDSIYQARSK